MAIAKVSDCLDRRRLGFPKPNQAAASLYSRGLEGKGKFKGSDFDADQCTCTARLMHARPVSRSFNFFSIATLDISHLRLTRVIIRSLIGN